MSTRIAGLLIIAAQITLYAIWKAPAERKEEYTLIVWLTGIVVVYAVVFANLWVFMKALLMITGWE